MNIIAVLTAFLRLFFLTLGSGRNVLSTHALLKKENEILLRRLGKKRVQVDVYDKLFLVVLNGQLTFGTAVARPKILRKSFVYK